MQVLVGLARGLAAAGRAHQEALLDEVGLVDVLERVAILGQRGGERFDARPGRRRSAAIIVRSSRRSPASRPSGVDLQAGEGVVGGLAR